ncbi:MAG: hypothetical protein WHV67_05645, partial [Thermoanaerobaculia bacterium]
LKEEIEKLGSEFSGIEEFLNLERENFEKLERDLREKEREIQSIESEITKLKELKERELSLIKDHEKEKDTLAFILKPPLEWEKVVDVLFEEISSAVPSREEDPKDKGLFMLNRKVPVPEIEGAIPVKEILKIREDGPQWILEALPPIYFLKDKERAREISQNYPYFAFFDEEGNYYKGSLLGKAPYSKSGLIGSIIKAEILERKIMDLERTFEEKEIYFKKLEEDLKLKESQLEEKSIQREKLFLKISDLKNNIGQIDIQKRNVNERLQEISKKIENYKKDLAEMEEKQKINLEEAGKYLEKEAELKHKIEQIGKEIEDIKKVEKEKQFFLQNRLKNLKEAEIEKERIKGEILKIKEKVLRDEEELKSLLEEKAQNLLDIEKISQEKESLEREYFLYKEKEEKNREELSVIEQEKEKIERKIREFQNILKKIREEMEENLKLIESLKGKDEIIKVRLEELEDRASSILGIPLKECPSNNEENLNEKIQKIKEKKERFGQINPLAEKELEEVWAKVEFIKKQKEDLENSAKALREDLKELENQAIKRFQETFQRVNENFQKYFTYLFGGGQAKIVLQNEENPLEAGIELVVEPPGKKIQHIMLLSGGERALVSFAFLLSLFSVSPSPFLFLDEADAALDDFNVERFINLINRLKEEIQIILVTHNRRTMEEASLLLGVTMEEPGLSKILPLSPKEVLEKLA